MTVKKLQGILNNGPYTWPGGYPLYFITKDCVCLSFESVNDNTEEVFSAIENEDDPQWQVIGHDVNWENELYCDHSGKPIEMAYPPE